LRTAYDLRWAAVLGRHAGESVCVKSTLQLFRGHLIIHEGVRNIFLSSIREARRAGLLKGKALRVAVDTKPIECRGAVEDTYNLLATGIRQLARALARSDRQQPEKWDETARSFALHGVKHQGQRGIDWSDQEARDSLIAEIVKDARKLLGMVSNPDEKILAASSLLMDLLLQDIEETKPASGEPAVSINKGTDRDRIPLRHRS